MAQEQGWAQVLADVAIVFEGAMNDGEAELRGPSGRRPEFFEVPGLTTVENRLHLCLRPVAMV